MNKSITFRTKIHSRAGRSGRKQLEHGETPTVNSELGRMPRLNVIDGTHARKYAMAERTSVSIAEYFAELSDPRRREGVYPLFNFVVIAICAVICGCDDFVSIAELGMTFRLAHDII